MFLSSSNRTITHSLDIATQGRPVFVSCSGDINYYESDDTVWILITIYRDNTPLCCQCIESTKYSQNIPFCLTYLDIVPQGSHTYRVNLDYGYGTAQLSEVHDYQSPNFLAFEI